MANARIYNSVANSGIRGTNPHVRVSNAGTGRSGEQIILAGTPIGLLLSLTYAENQALPTFSDERPNVRIVTA